MIPAGFANGSGYIRMADVPDAWLQGPDAFADPARQREAYVEYLCKRLQAHADFTREAIDARR